MPKFLANPVRVFPWLSSDQVPDSHVDVPRWFLTPLYVLRLARDSHADVAIWALYVLQVRSHCCAWPVYTTQREVQRRLRHERRLRAKIANERIGTMQRNPRR